MSLPEYYNRVNPDLLRVIPAEALAVLEVGCGTGVMGEQFLAVAPGCRYVGIEMNPEAAALAQTRLHRVVVGNVETLDLDSLGFLPATFDALVFGDVLEHLVDPWGVLQRLGSLLKPGGQAVACIPNVQHWTMILDLLRGRWEYQDEGLMDRTHLRFFAAEELRPLFARAGLEVFDVKPRWWPSPEMDAFHQMMTPVVRQLGLDPVQFTMRTRALQYVVRSVKADAPPSNLAIQTLIGEPLVCARVRVMEPDRCLGTVPGVRTVASTDASHLGKVLPGESRIFVRQRNILLEDVHLEGQKTLLGMDFLVVAEFDDDPRHFPEIALHASLTFAGCHAVQTSTATLADVIRPHNPHVAVFPNQIALLPPSRVYREDRLTTLFFGALNREKDWADILPAINRVLRERAGTVQIHIVYDRALFDALDTDLKTFQGFSPYEQYASILAASDIALLPLNPSPFNACKSDLKFIESAAHGAVALASPTVYGDTIDDGRTGVIYDNPRDFEDKLNLLIDDHTRRHAIARNAYQYVAQHRMLSQHFRERLDWYRHLIAIKPQLDRDLGTRVPSLRAGQASNPG